MPKGYHSRDIIRLLEKEGFVLKSVRGSHHKYVKGSLTTIVPHPKKDLKYGTTRAILHLAHLTISDLEK